MSEQKEEQKGLAFPHEFAIGMGILMKGRPIPLSESMKEYREKVRQFREKKAEERTTSMPEWRNR